jgi:hypothetical protein
MQLICDTASPIEQCYDDLFGASSRRAVSMLLVWLKSILLLSLNSSRHKGRAVDPPIDLGRFRHFIPVGAR